MHVQDGLPKSRYKLILTSDSSPKKVKKGRNPIYCSPIYLVHSGPPEMALLGIVVFDSSK